MGDAMYVFEIGDYRVEYYEGGEVAAFNQIGGKVEISERLEKDIRLKVWEIEADEEVLDRERWGDV